MRLNQPENKWIWQVSILSVVLGMFLAAALKTQTWIRATMDIPSGRFGPLAQRYVEEKQQNTDAQKRIKQLQDQISAYEKSHGRDGALRNELSKAKLLAGMTPVEGEGLEVTLQDSRLRPPSDLPPELLAFYNVHDSDLRDFVHILFANGAEAISIKDADGEERVILTTSIICTNGTIKVNSVRMGSPFVIKAVGPPNAMEQALNMAGGFMAEWRPEKRLCDSMVRIEKKSSLSLPAYAGDVEFVRAHVVDGGR